MSSSVQQLFHLPRVYHLSVGFRVLQKVQDRHVVLQSKLHEPAMQGEPLQHHQDQHEQYTGCLVRNPENKHNITLYIEY